MEDCNKYNNCIGCPYLKKIKIDDQDIPICENKTNKKPIQYAPEPGPDDVIIWNMDDLYDTYE